MLKKVLGLLPGNLHKDSSRSLSPAKTPKALQQSEAAPTVVQVAFNDHAAGTAACHKQQQLSGAAAGSAETTNGHAATTPAAATATAAGPAAQPAASAAAAEAAVQQQQPDPPQQGVQQQQLPQPAQQPDQQQQQQQQPAEASSQQLATSSDGPTDSSAAAGAAAARLVPPVPPLAPVSGVLRTSSAGSNGGSRRASLLSDAGRASSRSSLPSSSSQQLSPQVQFAEDVISRGSDDEQRQQQQPAAARPAVSQLPLHLVPGLSGSVTPPPFVAAQQTGSPDPLQQQQQQQQPFWHSSNWSFGCHSEQNKRLHMEDRFAAEDLTGTEAFASAHRAGFFAVYDGHSGHEAAEYLRAHLQSYVLAAGAQALAEQPLEVLSSAVQQAEREILASYEAGVGFDTAGSTLCALLLVDDKLHVAHVGDSRAVLGRGAEPVQLTRDHKPQCRIEAARIEVDDPHADISCDGYLYGEVAVARAIGSAAWKRDPSKRALIPTPDLISIQLQPEDDFVLLATDGLWDKVDNTQAVAATRRCLVRSRDPEAAARTLVERAQRLDSTDNITVVTLLLHGRAIAMPKSNSMLFKRSAALCNAIAAATGGADSPPGCSTPCSGASTPASGATPRSCTPSRVSSLISTASAPAAAVAAAAAAAAAIGPTASAPGPSPVTPPQPAAQPAAAAANPPGKL